MLSSLFIGQIVKTVDAALASAGVRAGRILVSGQTRVARALEEMEYRVITVAEKRRALRRVRGARVCLDLERLPVADDALDGLVAFDASQRPDWSRLIAEWPRAVRPGGAIVLVDRASPSDLTRRALCGGLTEIEQRQTGRTFVTSGLVSRPI